MPSSRSLPSRLPALLLVALAALSLGPHPARAGDVLEIPLRWCALEGSPAVENPMGAPLNPYNNQAEPDTNNVLWRRHERASDNVWIPGAQITFRSAITAAVMSQASFPIIPDACPPSNPICQSGSNHGARCTPKDNGTSNDCDSGVTCASLPCPSGCGTCVPGDLGDVLDVRLRICLGGSTAGASCTPDASGGSPQCDPGVPCDNHELALTDAACNAAWDALIANFGTNLVGPIAWNLNNWVDEAGSTTELQGWGGFAGRNVEADFCAIPPSNVTRTLGGKIAVRDNQHTGSDATVELLVAHELGHVMKLGHGNGLDDDNDGGFDDGCDPLGDEEGGGWTATPHSVMSPVLSISTATVTSLQRDRVREFAKHYDDVPQDPPGVLVPGPVLAAQRVDPPLDVADDGIDLVSIAMFENEDVQVAGFSHFLFGFVPFDELDRQYVVFTDLDGNPGTGGTPADLGFSTAFAGAELVTRVVVSTVHVDEFLFLVAHPTVWRFQLDHFVECGSAEDPACGPVSADVDAPLGGEDVLPTAYFNVVSIEMPSSVRGAAGADVRIQGLAEQLAPSPAMADSTLELDRLPDGPLEGASDFYFSRPVFPECVVTPDPATPGAIATVQASGFPPERMAKVFLGDRAVAGAMTAGDGSVAREFRIPVTRRSGTRLVTVGLVGTALTADCFLEVGEAPRLFLTPEAGTNAVGQDHTVVATVADEAGNPVSGVTVAFSVDAGPNAGAAGTCTFDPGCATDADGAVFFTYTGAGGPGIDRITASAELEGLGEIASNEVFKAWDEDCNQNEIADRCDVDCAGFDGLCGEAFVGFCGMSADANGDDFPDECNRPPDCSNAGAEPDELWPPQHGLKTVSVAGVTDEDGDPVSLVIDSIFQDEVVDDGGDGATVPDGAGAGTATAVVRAERDGGLDGRVYHIGFTADDGRGGTCSGEVAVCIPHDPRPGHRCVDQGPLYDSTPFARRASGVACGLGVELVAVLGVALALRRQRAVRL
jgi:hypothetical protein